MHPLDTIQNPYALTTDPRSNPMTASWTNYPIRGHMGAEIVAASQAAEGEAEGERPTQRQEHGKQKGQGLADDGASMNTTASFGSTVGLLKNKFRSIGSKEKRSK